MSLVKVQKTIFEDSAGTAPAEGAVCSVFFADSGMLANLYTTRSGVTSQSNPITTGAGGLLSFYVESGRYDIDVVHASGTQSYDDYLAVSEVVVSGPAPTAEFETVENMVLGLTTSGTTIDYSKYEKLGMKTAYNNSTSKAGSAPYIIKTVAQAASDGDVIDGTGAPNYYGANHALTGGTHVAVLNEKIPSIFSFGKVRAVDNDVILDLAIAYAQNQNTYVDLSSDEVVYAGSGDYTAVRGSGFITFNDIEFTPVRMRSQPSNIAGSWGMYCEELNGSVADAYKIASLGAQYVVYNYYGLTDAGRAANTVIDFQNLARFGVGVILSVANSIDTVARTSYIEQFDDQPNLIGWYVFDEPLTNSISKADQVAGIAASKAVKNLPCYCSEHGNVFPSVALPDGYDFVFVDTYFQAVNGNAAITTEEKVLEWYGSSIRSIYANYNLSQLIPIYESYATTVTTPLIAEDQHFASMYNKYQLLGPGCFFIYSAEATNPATLLTIKNTPQLERVTKRVIQSPCSKFSRYKQFTISSFDATYGPAENQVKSRWLSLLGAGTTGVIRAGGISRYGMFLDATELWVIDLGVVAKSIRIVGRFFNNGAAGGTTSDFDYYIPFNASLSEGYIYSTESVTTDGAGNANFGEYLQDINSRFVVIDTAAYTDWNTATGFDAFHISIIE